MGECLQHIDLTPAQQGAVHFEGRIFGSGANEGNVAGLDVREEGVLLRFVETVDFVDEDDGSALFAGFFFIAGHSTRFQRRILGSSRSIARRSGRWQLNPLSPNKRQT